MGVDQDIFRLDVAMDQMLVVPAVGERIDQIAGDLQGPARPDAAAPPQQGQHGFTLDQLHGVVVKPFAAAGIVNLDDVGMVEDGGGPRLMEEALDVFCRAGVSLMKEKDLDGNGAAEVELDGAINDTHAAASNLVFEFITTQDAPGTQLPTHSLVSPVIIVQAVRQILLSSFPPGTLHPDHMASNSNEPKDDQVDCSRKSSTALRSSRTPR